MILPVYAFVLALLTIEVAGLVSGASQQAATSHPDEPACQVKSIQKYPQIFESYLPSPASDLYEINQADQKGIFQVYIGKSGTDEKHCISCDSRGGMPRVDRHKMMVSWHPSGQWLFVGVEETKHDNMWMPQSWQQGLLQSGIWLNIWATTPTGDRWYPLTDYRRENGPSNGFSGTAFTPDGKKAVWAEIVDGNIFANKFGIWKLYMADFVINASGTPQLANRRDITPPGAKWVEPGNFSPDGRHLLISTDLGLKDAQGQDQWTLDVSNGQLKQLTNSPKVWDEHGVYSPNGRKVVFMSSYPYQDKGNTYKTISLKTEFMLMDADGTHLQQLTHFNVPGYVESQKNRTIAAVANFIGDGSQIMATIMGPKFTKIAWIITFQGKCGGR